MSRDVPTPDLRDYFARPNLLLRMTCDDMILTKDLKKTKKPAQSLAPVQSILYQ
jgi:hypothetical protein